METRTNTSTRFNLKFFTRVLKKDTPESFILLCFIKKTFVQLFMLKEVKPSPDSKMIKLLTLDDLFSAPTTFSLKLVVE